MNWITLKPDNDLDWKRVQSDLMAFIRKYGGKRAYSNIYQKLLKLNHRDLSKAGTSFELVTVQTEDGPRIAACSGVTGYGQGMCIIVVHPLYRGLGLGTTLLRHQLAAHGSLTCRIALGDLHSLRMGFRAGLCGRRLIKFRDGKLGLLLQDSWQGLASTAGKQHSAAANLAQRR
ncbi:GNAT family N-acetyltransferase [Paenibacillus aceti]|uniref:N-acetyltransferase domain-containing protein n=1 Tax=Paenibacillus aceti TaxID=1820010 RepID=A0ABQ1VT97_9BACL|nr:GNAT family N-acetyltransferase [Paenibacillus aceti]GGF92470.1 hypothetical protein GCM10010913_12570 [Paenibacillus aceti]